MGGLPKYSEVAHSALLVALLATMGVAGYANLKHQWGIIGEFSNYPLEEMVEWIKSSTPKGEKTVKCYSLLYGLIFFGLEFLVFLAQEKRDRIQMIR